MQLMIHDLISIEPLGEIGPQCSPERQLEMWFSR